MFLIELNPAQLVYLTGLMSKTETVPGDKVMEHASIFQQLQQPQQTDKFVQQIRDKVSQEMMSPDPRQIPGPGAAMQPMPPQG